MLKMNPAAAAPSAARTNSAPELMITCSLSIISSTAAAKAPPWPRLKSGSPATPLALRPGPSSAGGVRRPRSANGMTISAATGAIAMPTATNSSLLATPIATAMANSNRETLSTSSNRE
jgi:hypothetical protein